MAQHPRFTTRRDALKGAAALSSLMLASCSGRDDTSAGGAARVFRKDDLTPLERQFGVGPGQSERDGDNYLKVRSDLHLVEAGPAAVRAVAPNGLSWTLDPKLTGPIEVGRVMFVTNRCAGRVLATRPAGEHVEVVMGPAELTDFIEEADITAEQALELDQGVEYSAPDYPGAVSKVGGGGAPAPAPAVRDEYAARDAHSILTRNPSLVDSYGNFLRAQNDGPPEEDPRFTVTPFADPSTLGIQITSANDILQMTGDARMRFNLPKLYFNLKIGGRKLIHASVKISGSAALLFTFRAHSNYGVHGNVRVRYFVPKESVFDVVQMKKLPTPFGVTMRHMFMLQTAFSSKGNVDAVGQYGLDGALQMSFDGVEPTFGGPTNFEVQRSLAKSTSGVTMGPAGLIMTHQVRAIVGLNAFGFVTGPYVGLTNTAAVTKGSSADTMKEQCREATVRMSIHAGVGYQIPKSVANAINFVLGLFHVKGIPAEGGFQTGDKELISKTDHYPSLQACAASTGKTT